MKRSRVGARKVKSAPIPPPPSLRLLYVGSEDEAVARMEEAVLVVVSSEDVAAPLARAMAMVAVRAAERESIVSAGSGDGINEQGVAKGFRTDKSLSECRTREW